MSLQTFCEWLENTEGSQALHSSAFMFPLVESIHVWGIAFFVGLAMMLDLRLLSLTLRKVPVSELAHRLLPWMSVSFVIMLISGIVTFYARPVHYYHSIFFRVKLVLLILAATNAWVFHSTVWLKVADWDRDPVPPPRARFAGAASLILWACIIVLGRMIAYNWFDCGMPQPAIISFLSGCGT